MADIATLGLRVDATGLDEGKRKLQELGDQASTTEKKAESLGRTMQRAGTMIAGAWITRAVIQNTIEAQNAIAMLDARIRSTGGAAGRSRADLEAMAASLQRLTTFEDEAVMGAQAMLMTFKQIKGAEFDRATKMTLDLAAAMGGDAKGAALQLGKALEDPTQGLSALRRSGISFTEAQQDQIKAMMEAGEVAKAQNFILAEMETQVGGTAAAMRDTLGGALAGLKNDFGDLLEVTKESSKDIIALINMVAALVRKFNELRGAIGDILPADLNNPALSWLMGRFGGGSGGGGGQSQAVADTSYLIPLMDTLTVSVSRTAAAYTAVAAAATQAATAQKQAADSGPASGLTTGRNLGGFGYDYLSGLTVTLPDIVEAHSNAASKVQDEWLGAFAVITMAVGRNSSAMVAALQDVIFQVQSLRKNAEEMSWQMKYASIAAAGFGVGNAIGGTTTNRFYGGVSGGIGGAAAGFAMGGPVGALVGGVAGVVGGLLGASKAAKQAAEEAKRAAEIEKEAAEMRRRAREDLETDFNVRRQLLDAENEWARERVRIDAENASQQKDLQRMLQEGIITETEYWHHWEVLFREYWGQVFDLEQRQKDAAEETARAAEEAAQAQREYAEALAETTRQLAEDLAVRGLRLIGQGGAADTLALGIRQRRERGDYAGQSDEMLRLLDFVHGMERKELAFNQAVDAINAGLEQQLSALEAQESAATEAWQKQDAGYADQIELAEAALRVTEEAYNEQIKAAQEQLRVAEDQLRAQEQTVESLRTVVANLADYRQSLLTSDLSQLSPVQQLEVARDEFTRLAGLASRGDVTAGNALPGASRTFLEISRGVNASGSRYQSDWDAVNNVLFTVQGKFQAQLSVEERMLAALQTQVGQLNTQIDTLSAARDAAVRDAQAQIAELQAAREQARREYEAQIAAIQEQMRIAQQAADAQIAALRAEFAAAQRLWQAQLEELIRQTGLLATIGTYITDQGGGQIPPDIKPDLALIVANTAAGVNVQQAGFSGMAAELAGLRAEVAGLRADTRRGMELAF